MKSCPASLKAGRDTHVCFWMDHCDLELAFQIRLVEKWEYPARIVRNRLNKDVLAPIAFFRPDEAKLVLVESILNDKLDHVGDIVLQEISLNVDLVLSPHLIDSWCFHLDAIDSHRLDFDAVEVEKDGLMVISPSLIVRLYILVVD